MKSQVAFGVLFLVSFATGLVGATDNKLVLLSGILRTYQVSACDDESLTLECDSRTVVDIVVATYGHHFIASRDQCPGYLSGRTRPLISSPSATSLLASNNNTGNGSSVSTSVGAVRNQPPFCPDSYHLRYLFLRKVREVCREKSRCSLEVNAHQTVNLTTDPCPNLIKVAEVAYKCRPELFINKILCEDAQIRLSCNAEDRLLIFSAEFGATGRGEDKCPGTSVAAAMAERLGGQANSNHNFSNFSCQSSYASKIAMTQCHGKRSCTLAATTSTFGHPPCPAPNVRHFLKVVYTCTSKKMLNMDRDNADDNLRSAIALGVTSSTTTTSTTTALSILKPKFLPNNNNNNTDDEDDDNEDEDNGEGIEKKKKEPESSLVMMDAANSGNKRPSGGDNSTKDNCTLTPQMHVIGFVSDWISAIGFIRRNQERLILYLLVSFFGSLVCFLVVLSTRLYFQKGWALRKARQDKPPPVPFDFEDDDDEDADDGGVLGAEEIDLDTGTTIPLRPIGRQGTHAYMNQGSQTVPGSFMTDLTYEPRPLLYSTLHKVRNASGGSGSGNSLKHVAHSQRNTVISSSYPSSGSSVSMITVAPKSILTNRIGPSEQTKPMMVAFQDEMHSNSAGSVAPSPCQFVEAPSVIYAPGSSGLPSFGNITTTQAQVYDVLPPPPPPLQTNLDELTTHFQTIEIKTQSALPSPQTQVLYTVANQTDPKEELGNTQPKMLQSKSLNNFFI